MKNYLFGDDGYKWLLCRGLGVASDVGGLVLFLLVKGFFCKVADRSVSLY